LRLLFDQDLLDQIIDYPFLKKKKKKEGKKYFFNGDLARSDLDECSW
jgi:hypothetical protein